MKGSGSVLCVVILLGMLMTAGCASDAQTGALMGGGAGALAGQAIGGDTKSTLIGGAAGAALGYGIGNERDKAKATRERQALSQQMNTTVVNVTNSNGSMTPVTLRRVGSRWVGPRGEEYSSIPTGEQLRPIYGF